MYSSPTVLDYIPGRPKSRPSYNFIRQLQFFAQCNYDVSPTEPSYIAWQAQQNFDEANSLRVIDGMPVLPDQLFLSLCVSL